MTTGGWDEFELIARLFRPLAAGTPGALELKDDAALLAVPPGQELVATSDALVAGIHFLPDDPPDLIARKALRVNLSDLAAKGAKSAFYLLSAVLPRGTSPEWLQRFANGLREDQAAFGIGLAGGDTTATDGPLTLSITALGFVPTGGMIRRSGARPGDAIFVSGTIGDAALGLLVSQGGLGALGPVSREHLRGRYRLPEPRVAFGGHLSSFAHAAIDVSDGLVADLDHVLAASGVGARLELGRVPLSPPAQEALASGAARLEDLVIGGDDYEILFTAPPEARTAIQAAARDLPIAEIGTVVAGQGLVIAAPDGTPITLTRTGFRHF